ncbi:unnamed protein product, partial [Chrysoparadoxa australica]
PEPTRSACWHCCHPFDWSPCATPVSYDRVKNVYLGSGNFCTWNCCRQYNMVHSAGKGLTLIALITTKLRKQLKELDGCYSPIVSVPPRNSLVLFGGNMTISEYRKGCLK